MELDRLRGKKQRSGDFAIRPAFRDELNNAPLGGSQFVMPGCSAADPRDLIPRTLREDSTVQPLELGERLRERLSCVPLSLRAPESTAVRKQRSRPIEGEQRELVLRERTLERRQRIAAAGGHEQGAAAEDVPERGLSP
jgi:hypothetical protein